MSFYQLTATINPKLLRLAVTVHAVSLATHGDTDTRLIACHHVCYCSHTRRALLFWNRLPDATVLCGAVLSAVIIRLVELCGTRRLDAQWTPAPQQDSIQCLNITLYFLSKSSLKLFWVCNFQSKSGGFSWERADSVLAPPFLWPSCHLQSPPHAIKHH